MFWMLWLVVALGGMERWEVRSTPERDTVVGQWRDAEGREQLLDASLPSGSFEAAPIWPGSGHAHTERSAEALRAWAKEEGLSLEITVDEGGLHYGGPGSHVARAKEALPGIKEAVDRDLFALREDGVRRADLARIVSAYVEPLRPVSRGLGPMLDTRPLAERAMSMVQRLDYAKGSGDFRSPLAVIRDGKGDCDEKAALFAALVRAQEPTLPLAIVRIDGHAFAAIDLHAHPGDQTLRLGEHTLVVAEPVGPSMQSFGRLAPRSRAAVEAGAYTVVWVPPTNP